MPIKFTEEMKELINNALANKTACFVGSASKKGEPMVTYRGSVMVFDDQRLAWWERGKKKTWDNIRENPRVVVVFVDFTKHAAWKIHGSARVYETGPVREQVMQRTVPQELSYDPERKGAAVVIDVDLITDFLETPLQTR
ncbi:MAG: pyridoxamine 5'-phosphate oxidase family protein [Dehalococcoidia bacterium]|nr:pyridoxamine 5'-phosphate oxidase family protein [Dehalococcoidia bacterium]